ncbi:uncharacterized protein B0P05DRAFT_565088 [Gilbertella persicaria]|uniref:uncharacterized protein n=1 Tax=Gilbertella persicaria TaxID=101096 RepID=UPI00221E5721|nr:uncharacterized protein B0P05DRAFT_565088 [Gilbertella persicaria]KAI8047966.1 hypothetical protein B0P05DRAFT_565088 [Gilbertella persicaria]
MNINEQSEQKEDLHHPPSETLSSQMNIGSELTAILSSTFQYVGMEFIDMLLKEITIQTKVHSTLLLQLLSLEEYRELCSIYKSDEQKKLNIISCSQSSSSSPEIRYPSCGNSDNTSSPQHPTSSVAMDSTPDQLQDQFLLIRSCFSNQASMKSSLTNTIIPLLYLNSASPYIKTLLNDHVISLLNQHTDTEQQEVERGIYPSYQHFVGLKLDSNRDKNDTIKGILCVTDSVVIESSRMNTITTILNFMQTRCINELSQLRKQEQLISARDLALLDAENKLKFLADMSHEIRTPMNAVIALTDLLLQERSTLNIEQIEHLEVIQTSGSHLLTIINDILDISKLNHDPKFKLESRRFSLRKCLKDTLNMARHQASMSQQNKVVYVLECPPDKDDNVPLPQLISQLENSGVLLRPLLHKKGKTVLPVIWKIDPDVPDHLFGDTMRLTQIMLNLCSNAVKFTKQGGIHIRIKRSTPTPLRTPSARLSDKRMTFKERYDAKIETIWNQAMQDKRDRSNSYNPLPSTEEEVMPNDYFGEKSILEISVTDTGIGIPADRLPKLFKSFSQIDISTARRYGGTGLGLAISSTLVNRMGGCVWVESEEGVGSRFALTLPMTVAPRGRNHSSDSTPLGFAGSPSSPGSTVSDSSSSVHSALGNATSNSGGTNDIISPLSSAYFTFSTPTITSAGSTASGSGSGYFPVTTAQLASQQQQQQQQHQQRPLLSRSTQQQYFATEPFNQQRSEPISIPQIIENSTNEQSFSPMAEDGHPLNPNVNMTTNSGMESDTSKRINVSGGSNVASNSGGNNARKSYNDLLSPATRNNRVSISKQHYHNRKPQTKEENLAKAHPLRILLAEDNILNQKIAISILKRLGYIDVAIANNGSEVLTLMKSSVFDVIFMDLYMPEMDGLEVTREIIKERTRQKQLVNQTTENTTPSSSSDSESLLNSIDVYIIALTASASREDRQICIDAGMNDFISKPFTMTEMKSALKTCANKRKKRRKLTQKQMDIEDDTPATSSIIEDIDGPAITSDIAHHSTDDPMMDVQTATTHTL